VIGASGGVVTARASGGHAYYVGTTQNGVESRDYGAWGGTIVFDGSSSPEQVLGTMPPCPGTGREMEEVSTVCRCKPAHGDGSLWGTDVYTGDSSTCTAAIHAGVVSRQGGMITVVTMPGQRSYAGTTRNGVTSGEWGAFGSSFRVGMARQPAAERANAAPAAVQAQPAQPGDTTIGWDVDYAHLTSDAKLGVLWCPAAPARMRPQSRHLDRLGNETIPDFTVSGIGGAYSTGSRVCLAAVHRGVISWEGGRLRVKAKGYADADTFRDPYEDHGAVTIPRLHGGDTFDITRP
jgi:hypothetical protein